MSLGGHVQSITQTCDPSFRMPSTVIGPICTFYLPTLNPGGENGYSLLRGGRWSLGDSNEKKAFMRFVPDVANGHDNSNQFSE